MSKLKRVDGYSDFVQGDFDTLYILLAEAQLQYTYSDFDEAKKLLNTYTAEADRYNEQIEEAKEIGQELADTKEHLDSKEYIEDVAREKLDMYLPNEKVYIDISK